MKDIYRAIGVSCGKTDALDLRARARNMEGTAIIDEEVKIPQFANKDYSKWPVGAPVADEGQVWQLLQPYDAGVHTEHPAQLRAMWSLCHTQNPAKAKPWVDPLGTSGMYMKDECYKAEDGTVYRAKRDNIVHDVSGAPKSWEAVSG